jgi:hypothetical protein
MTVTPQGSKGPSGNRSNVRVAAVAALVLALVAGVAFGWGFGQRLDWPRPPRDGGGRFGRMGPGHGPFDRLHLTAAQRVAVDSIFRVRRAQIDAFWRGPGRQLGVILDSTSADVRAVLDSSQRATFDVMQHEFRRGGHGRPGGPEAFGGPGGPPPDGRSPRRDGRWGSGEPFPDHGEPGGSPPGGP